MSTLDEVKVLLDIDGTDRDELLGEIISLTESRLRSLISADEVPDSLDYITVEVTVRRFNRIGSEGASSHTVEGETMTWTDDDFAPFMDDIQRYRDANASSAGRKAVFL